MDQTYNTKYKHIVSHLTAELMVGALIYVDDILGVGVVEQ